MTPGGDRAGGVSFAAALARRFQAPPSDVAAEDYVLSGLSDEMGPAMETAVIDNAAQQLSDNFSRARAGVSPDGRGDEWRSAVRASRAFLTEQARAADLIVMSRQGNGDASQGRMAISHGGLIMEIGRPVLVVPPKTQSLSSERIVVA